MIKQIIKVKIFSLLMVLSEQVNAVEVLNIKDEDSLIKVAIGGYAKVDVRYVDGDIAYQDYWIANFPSGRPVETSHIGFHVRESRINFRIQRDDVYAFFELDMYGGGGNEVVSNSSNPRLRHYYINYKNWRLGQDWTTFMPLHALPESLDFGGPHVGEVFARETQIRYTNGNWQFAIENPETNGDGDTGSPSNAVGLSGDQADPDESVPDFIARYNHSASWGRVSVAGLVRLIDQGGLDEVGEAFNLAAKINTVGKNDFRFQVTYGNAGRYASAGMTPDIVRRPGSEELEVESTVAFALAYRHFWTASMRSTLYYGAAETDILGRKRAHWAINLIDTVGKHLDIGVELGNYAINDDAIDNIDSYYLQFSGKFSF